MSDCIFCKIIAGQIPSNIEYEDDSYLVFHDITPKARTHLLIIPKQHIETINDLQDDHADLIGGMFLLARDIAKKRNITDYNLKINV